MARILLLEPNQLLASQYKQFLESKGYTVVSCKNAQDGINRADQINPELVVMELLLAAHSGIEFLYEFRSYGEWRKVPVIVLSRIPRSEIIASDKVLNELGISVFLYKPETTLQRLGERVSAVLPIKSKSVS